MKTLVIFAHPDFEKSRVNKRWIKELEKYPDEFMVHKLYSFYPDEKIDVKKEQKLVEEHGNIILQFPLYWFSSPSLLKKWLDEVLTPGFAYGENGDNFKNRKIGIAVTIGNHEEAYTLNGMCNCTLENILLPFEATVKFIGGIYGGYNAIYGIEYDLSDIKIENSLEDYVKFCKTFCN